jgi:predicted amidophosphoribosyltransferase
MECAPFVHQCCNEYLAEAALPLRTLGIYESHLRTAVLALKQGRRDVAQAAALHLAERVSDLEWLPGAVLVPMPTAAHRVRLRGVDGAAFLAGTIAERLELRVVRALHTRSIWGQRGRSRSQRLVAAGRFAVRSCMQLQGFSVVLIDDVVTTGATLREAALALRSGGATVRGALALARTLIGG